MISFTLAHSYISQKHWYVNEDSHLKNIRVYTWDYAQLNLSWINYWHMYMYYQMNINIYMYVLHFNNSNFYTFMSIMINHTKEILL